MPDRHGPINRSTNQWTNQTTIKLRWEFIKENKKGRKKKESDQNNYQEKKI